MLRLHSMPRSESKSNPTRIQIALLPVDPRFSSPSRHSPRIAASRPPADQRHRLRHHGRPRPRHRPPHRHRRPSPSPRSRTSPASSSRLNNGLQHHQAHRSADKATLNSERHTANSTVRVTPRQPRSPRAQLHHLTLHVLRNPSSTPAPSKASSSPPSPTRSASCSTPAAGSP